VPKYDLPLLVKEMVHADLVLMKKDEHLKKGGYTPLNNFE
jgi:GDPmannose 4,6-dehydratase